MRPSSRTIAMSKSVDELLSGKPRSAVEIALACTSAPAISSLPEVEVG